MPSNRKDAIHQLSGRVLIADDDEQFRYLLVRRAERMGLSVLEAEDGDEAMEALEKERFELIICDLYMPGHSGLEVIQSAQEMDKEIHAILLTASATVESAILALRSGIYDYLTKPLESLEVFDETVARALEHASLIRENKRLFEEVQRLAVTDGLTGLFNRRKLDEALASEFERARRYRRPLSIIMIDMDGLKSINDAHGHSAGDAALKRIAHVVRAETRQIDMPARFGGDEFVVLLPEVELELAVKAAERIFNKVQILREHGDMSSVSGGVAQLGDDHASAEDLLRAVDETLYQAKRAGREKFLVHNPEEDPV